MVPDHAPTLRVLVDESGDPGTRGKGTRWLVLAGVAESGAPGVLELAVEEARAHVRQSVLHLANVTFGRRKLRAYLTLADAPFEAIVVAADTTAVYPASGLTQPRRQYEYALRLLIERASELAADRGALLEVVVEQSDHLDLVDFQRQIDQLAANRRRRGRMRWGAVATERINFAAPSDEPCLGVADAVAFAYRHALEPPQPWDGTAFIFADILQPHLRRGGVPPRVYQHGLTLLPTRRAQSILDANAAFTRWAVEGKQIAPLLWRPGA